MKIGLIGYGAWGKHHANAILNTAGAELAAIVCNSEKSASIAQKEHKGVTVYRNYDELLKRKDIEAVDIVLPTFLHSKVAIKALNKGKNVLLEKPLAGSLEECDRLIDVANRSGKVLTIGHELRLSSQWRKVKEIIKKGKIGTPIYSLMSIFRSPFRKGSNNWRYTKSMVGSWILEELIHYFDLLLWFYEDLGEPVSIFAKGKSINQSENLYDNFSSILTFHGNSYAVITQTLAGFEHHQITQITGTKGSILSSWSGAMDRTLKPEFFLKIHQNASEQVEEIPFTIPSGELFELSEELKQTIELFKLNKPLFPAEEARKSVAVCLNAERSLTEQRDISLEL